MPIRPRRFCVLSIILAFVLAQGPAFLVRAEPSAPQVNGRLDTERGISILSLWGSPRERGFAHGWLLAEEVFQELEEGLSLILSAHPDAPTSLTPLLSAGFSFSPDETAEMEGMVEAIAKRFPDRKVKVFGRQLNLEDLKLINTYGDWYALGCSSAAVWGKLTADGKPAVVRNFDFMPLPTITRSQHLRVVAPSPDGKRRGWVGVALPGSLGPVTAMNAEGVFAAIHDVWIAPAPKDYLQGNVPRLVALRRIVEEVPAAGAVEKAADLCRSWNTLFGNNFLVATPDAASGLPAGVLEYDTREDREHGVTLRGPAAGAEGNRLEYVACSNGHRSRGTDKCWRYDALLGGCRERTAGPFDLPALEDLVSRSAVPAAGKPVKGNGVGTLHQMVALTGERRLWVRILESREKNIRDGKGVEVRVDELLALIPKAKAL